MCSRIAVFGVLYARSENRQRSSARSWRGRAVLQILFHPFGASLCTFDHSSAICTGKPRKQRFREPVLVISTVQYISSRVLQNIRRQCMASGTASVPYSKRLDSFDDFSAWQLREKSSIFCADPSCCKIHICWENMMVPRWISPSKFFHLHTSRQSLVASQPLFVRAPKWIPWSYRLRKVPACISKPQDSTLAGVKHLAEIH